MQAKQTSKTSSLIDESGLYHCKDVHEINKKPFLTTISGSIPELL